MTKDFEWSTYIAFRGRPNYPSKYFNMFKQDKTGPKYFISASTQTMPD